MEESLSAFLMGGEVLHSGGSLLTASSWVMGSAVPIGTWVFVMPELFMALSSEAWALGCESESPRF